MGQSIDLITTESAKVENESAVQTWEATDLSFLFGRGLENSFDATLAALQDLDRSESELGSAWVFERRIDPEILSLLQEMADKQEMIPVKSNHNGVLLDEVSSKLYLRLLLSTFKGSRLWDEKIEPHFDHILLSAILNDSSITEAFVYDIDSPHGLNFGIDTPNTVAARRISSLMERCKLRSNFIAWKLHEDICDHIRSEHGIQGAMDDESEWKKWYQYYWKLNDHILLNDEMRDFMFGRTLISIDVDFPSRFSSEELSEIFQKKEVYEYIRGCLHQNRDDREPLFEDKLLNLYMGQMVAYVATMVLSGRREGDEEISEFVKYELRNRKTKYTFFAAVRSEYLIKAKDKEV